MGTKKAKILIVGDRHSLLEEAQRRLAEEGYEVEQFEIEAPEPMPEFPEILDEPDQRPGFVKPIEAWQRRGRRKNKLFRTR